MNIGERDELVFKIEMIRLRDTQRYVFGEKVVSVGFGGFEYRALPEDFNMGIIPEMSDSELEFFAGKLGISKAATGAKSDIYINNVGISLKSLRAAPAALVNHTARPGFEFACMNANSSIDFLDDAVDEYWKLRLSRIISEDTKITDEFCPFKPYKDEFKPVIEYFLFRGSGSKLSPYPASGIIEFTDPLNPSTYELLTPDDAFKSVWKKLVFSMRAKKGMPNNYDKNTYRGKNAASIAKWVEYIDGDFRGALHIRCRK